MSNVYYDGKRYYKIDENGRRVSAGSNRTRQQQYDDLVRKSTKGNRVYSKPKTVRVYVDRLKVAIAALCTLCMVAGAGLVSIGGSWMDAMHDNKVLYSYSSEFRTNAINENTKRTQNNQYYYYEYDDINDYMEREGADYSQEAYLAYRNLGEHQMDRLFSEGTRKGPDSLQEFVESEGYDTIKDWEKAEREQLLLEHEMREKGYELREMADEIEQQAKNELSDSYASSDNFGGK